MAKRISAALVDLSGTIHVEDAVIPGAVEAVSRLRAVCPHVKFVTNTTKESRATLHARLCRIGFAIALDDIFTSLSAARRFIDEQQLRPMLMLEPDACRDFEGVPTESANSVVIGLAPSQFHYERLTEAMRFLLHNHDSQLIAIHKARYYKRSDGLALGPGAIVAGLEYATGKTAHVVGKPERAFFMSALASLGSDLSPEHTVMIGDDWRDDVQGAMLCGFRSILVKTGKYQSGDEDKLLESLGEKHQFCDVVDSFPDAVKLIEEINS